MENPLGGGPYENSLVASVVVRLFIYTPGTYNTCGIYRYLGMSRRAAVCKVLERGGNHIHNECFGPDEFGAARAQTPPPAHVRARVPHMRGHTKCAREPSFWARLVRLSMIVRRERARGKMRRQRRRTGAVTACSAHLVA